MPGADPEKDGIAGGKAVTVDARGMKCPWPALRLAKAMRTYESACLIADDPAASAEIASLAEKNGWRMVRESREGVVTIRVSRNP